MEAISKNLNTEKRKVRSHNKVR